jgi:uncharacterized protein
VSSSPSIAVCVFAKPPLPGQVKTRLAGLAPERTADLAQAFLRDTCALVQSLGWAQLVLASAGPLPAQARPPGEYEVWQQPELGLGARVQQILARALLGHRFAVALAADCPGLPARLLEQARQALEAGAPAVLGPADDGGFYLLGLSAAPEGLLDGLPWSSSETAEATLRRLSAFGMPAAVVDRWFDVDRPEDLARLSQLIALGEVVAPNTARALGL